MLGLQLPCLYEPDLVLPSVGPQDPRDLLHLANGRVAPIGVSGTGDDGEGDARTGCGEALALDDLVLEGDSLDDSGMAAGATQRGLSVSCRASDDLQTHGWFLLV